MIIPGNLGKQPTQHNLVEAPFSNVLKNPSHLQGAFLSVKGYDMTSTGVGRSGRMDTTATANVEETQIL